jgi:DNA polymerase-3 subunit alpha
VNRKVIECLIKAGAFDFTKVPRKRMWDSIDGALERGQSDQRDRAVGQVSLFGAIAAKTGKAVSGEDYVKGEEWPEKERLKLEKEAIGFYITGHPLEQYRREIDRFARPCAKVQGLRKDDKVTVAGVLVSLREKVTQTGKKMAWATLEDLSGSVDLVLFPPKDGNKPQMVDGKWQKGVPRQGYENWETLLKSDEPLLVKGSISINNRDEENPKAEIIADSVESLAAVRAQRAKRLEIRVDIDLATEERLTALHALCLKHPGNIAVAVQFLKGREAEVTVASGGVKVAVNDEMVAMIDRLFGAKVAEFA